MADNKFLKGKIALVTGASRGIGRAIAITLGQAGAKVVLNYQGNAAAAAETLAKIKETGAEGLLYQADVASSLAVETMVREIIAAHGTVDILVNNAGITRDALLIRMKDEDWGRVIETNLTGMFNCLKAVARPMMKQRGGRIINISSVVGISGNAGQINYAAAKAGVIGLTKSAAKELGSRGILVNAVAPGYILTEMTEKLGEEVKAGLTDRIPVGRLGKPEDIAELVLFLAGPGAAYITGQTITVDGGLVI